MYKLSQDHLELFFQMIRLQGGCNNNPTARQFTAAYKKLLVHSEICYTGNGNCTNLQNINIIKATSTFKQTSEMIINSSSRDYRAIDELIDIDTPLDHDYLFNCGALTETTKHSLLYSWLYSEKIKFFIKM